MEISRLSILLALSMVFLIFYQTLSQLRLYSRWSIRFSRALVVNLLPLDASDSPSSLAMWGSCSSVARVPWLVKFTSVNCALG